MELFNKTVIEYYKKSIDEEKLNLAWSKYSSYFLDPIIQETVKLSNEEKLQTIFLNELFVKTFDYTIHPFPNYNLETELKNIGNAKKTDGAIIKDGKTIAVIELKSTKTKDLSSVQNQAFGYKNHHPHCKYVIVSNFEKLSFYINDATKFQPFNLFNLTKDEFRLLWLCLHKESIFSDLPSKIKEKSVIDEKDITNKLYKDYSAFRTAIFNDILHRNPTLDKTIVFKKTQKLLDRFLFVLFAEDSHIIPYFFIDRIIKEYNELKTKYNLPISLYERFKQYFEYINTGYKEDGFEVDAYNGGLFKKDDFLDSIQISDHVLEYHTNVLTRYDFGSEVSVNVLGHIFEYSINKLEEIENELIHNKPINKKESARNKDGVFYTPAYITKYIVESTLGRICEEKKTELNIVQEDYQPYSVNVKGEIRYTTGKSPTPILKKTRERKPLKEKLDLYKDYLNKLTICDPAVGSGAFLNQALDFLISEHQYIADLESSLFNTPISLLDVEGDILENNLYGVDVNEESVEIAKLALWLKTAKKGRKLNTLSNNIKCGNSLIDDKEIDENAFLWEDEFPEIFEQGGFDVVIGNPPWGAKLPKAHKPFVKSKYICKKGEIETYIHFIEKCNFQLVKNMGICGLIVPNTWFYLEKFLPIRKLLLKKRIVELIQLEKKIFIDAPDIVPSIVTTLNIQETDNYNIDTYKLHKKIKVSQLINHIDFDVYSINSNNFLQLPSLPYNLSLTNEKLSVLNKLKKNNNTIFEFYNIRYGIKTGNNRLHVKDEKGDSQNWKYCINAASCVKKYSVIWENKWLNFGKHLSGYSDNSFEKPKILIHYIRKISMPTRLVCALDENGKYYPLNNFSFIEQKDENYNLKVLLGILNSKLINFYFQNVYIDYNIKPNYIEKLPLPKFDLKLTENIVLNVTKIIDCKILISNKKKKFINRLSSNFDKLNINNKLKSFEKLSETDFIKELKKQKIQLNLAEQDEWEEYFTSYKKNVIELVEQSNKINDQIDIQVYSLYGLNQDEIKIVVDTEEK